MKTKKFQEYLEKRLSKPEITRVEERAEREVKFLELVQKSIASSMED